MRIINTNKKESGNNMLSKRVKIMWKDYVVNENKEKENAAAEATQIFLGIIIFYFYFGAIQNYLFLKYETDIF